MTDMLVKLYDLPDDSPRLEELRGAGVTIRRAMPYERHLVTAWVRGLFGEGWASECETAFGAQPCTCLIATREGEILGFACYDATCRGFFGPTGVAGPERGRGLGGALLLAALRAMREAGYAYAVIGYVSSAEFYAKACGAQEIPGSTPGVYGDRLRPPIGLPPGGGDTLT